MKEKLSTKTIIMIIIAILLLSTATIGTVIFLKDSGKTQAAVEEQEVKTLPNTGSDMSTDILDSEKQETDNIDKVLNQDENEELDRTTNNNTQTTTIETEPNPSTVERERTIAETTTLGWTNTQLNGEENLEDLLINYNNLKYTVEYYFDYKVDEELTDTVEKNKKGKEISTYTDKIKNGYKFEKVENFPLIISEEEEKNVIKVYYAKDDTQTKEASYKVEYYKDVVLSDTETITETVWVNDTQINVDASKINITDKYIGYKFDSTDPSAIPTEIEENGIIKVYYIKDSTKTRKASYKVEYYKDVVLSDTETITETIWVNDTQISVDSSKINITDKYTGYKFDSTDPTTIPTEIEENGTIKVYYIKDSTKTREASYKVEYYKDAVLSDTETITKTVWVNDTQINVDASKINITDKYTGYKFDSTDPSTIPTEIEENGIIKVYYVKDSTKTRKASYKVEYYKDAVLSDTETITETIWINDTQISVDASKINITDKYTGYKFDSTDPSTIPTEIEENEIIKVYYVKDSTKTRKASYKVEYYKDAVLLDTETITETVWINDTQISVDASKINITNKYTGYYFHHTTPRAIPTEIEENGIIKVYYVKDNTKTREASYKVEYYKDAVLSDTETITETIWINDTQISVIRNKINVTNKYPGYKFKYTDPTTIPAKIEENGIIKVYYVKDSTKTREASYKVEYYKDAVLSDTETITETVWVNDTQINVDASKINITDKYAGYKFDHTNPSILPNKIKENGTIKVYYISKKSNIIVTKDVDKKNNLQVGDIIKYTIKAENKGEAAGKITITDRIPDYTALSGKITATGVTENITEDMLNKGIVLNIQAGKTSKVEFSVKILPSAIGKTIKNKAFFDGNPTDEVVTDDITKQLKVTANVGVVKEKGLNYIIMIDASSSMYPEYNGLDDRIGRAKTAVKSFMRKVFEETPDSTVTIVRFGYKADLVGRYNKDSNLNDIKIKMYLMNTDIKAGLEKGAEYKVNTTKNVMILLSDGAPYEYPLGLIGYPHYDVETNPDNIAKVARRIESDNNTNIYCIGFGKDANKPSGDAYKALAKISNNGKVLTSNETEELIGNFNEIIYSSTQPETIKLKNKVKEFDLGTKQIDSSRNIVITYDGGKEEYKFDGVGTKGPLTYSLSGGKYKLTFDLTNYLEKDNLQLKYYVK